MKLSVSLVLESLLQGTERERKSSFYLLLLYWLIQSDRIEVLDMTKPPSTSSEGVKMVERLNSDSTDRIQSHKAAVICTSQRLDMTDDRRGRRTDSIQVHTELER